MRRDKVDEFVSAKTDDGSQVPVFKIMLIMYVRDWQS